MGPDEPATLVRTDEIEHPEFTTERLALDAERATELIREAVKGVSATETPEGTKFRTRRGMLLAILTDHESGVDLHYRTAPASESATLKARRIWRALRPYAE